jgi:hypothetical protein
VKNTEKMNASFITAMDEILNAGLVGKYIENDNFANESAKTTSTLYASNMYEEPLFGEDFLTDDSSAENKEKPIREIINSNTEIKDSYFSNFNISPHFEHIIKAILDSDKDKEIFTDTCKVEGNDAEDSIIFKDNNTNIIAIINSGLKNMIIVYDPDTDDVILRKNWKTVSDIVNYVKKENYYPLLEDARAEIDLGV